MKLKENLARITLVLFLVSVLTVLFLAFPSVRTQEEVTIRVYPETVTVKAEETFSLNVTFENIPVDPGAEGFEFNLTWDTSVLNCVSMEEVLFHTITPEEEWFNIWAIRHVVSNGSVWYAYTWSDHDRAHQMGYAPTSGNGTLAILTFKSIAEGETTIHFVTNVIGDPDGDLIPSIPVDGTVIVQDWVLHITWKNTTYEVLVFTDCLIENYGFNHSLSQIYFDATYGTAWSCNVTIPKTLLDGAFKVLLDDLVAPSILTWNETHTFIYFNSTQLSHSVKIIGEIATRIPGDINLDEIVDIYDAIILAIHFGEES